MNKAINLMSDELREKFYHLVKDRIVELSNQLTMFEMTGPKRMALACEDLILTNRMVMECIVKAKSQEYMQ